MKRVSVLIVLVLLVGINSVSFAGDPLDSNDAYVKMNAVTGDPLDSNDAYVEVNAVTGDPLDSNDVLGFNVIIIYLPNGPYVFVAVIDNQRWDH